MRMHSNLQIAYHAADIADELILKSYLCNPCNPCNLCAKREKRSFQIHSSHRKIIYLAHRYHRFHGCSYNNICAKSASSAWSTSEKKNRAQALLLYNFSQDYIFFSQMSQKTQMRMHSNLADSVSRCRYRRWASPQIISVKSVQSVCEKKEAELQASYWLLAVSY